MRVMSTLVADVWLLPPTWHKTLTEIAANHAGRGSMQPEAQHAIAAAMELNPAPRDYEVINGTAIIPIEGVLVRKFSNVLHSSGVTSTDIVERLVRKATADSAVSSILLMIDSPGGYTQGIPEAAAAVRAAREVKPVIAYGDGMMDSAAYWIGSQGTAVYSMASGSVGSIGAYMARLDSSRALEMAGYKLDLFKSGPFKGMGMPGTQLTDEHRAMLQASVDTVADQFKAAVRSGRSHAIREDAMQGQSFSAEDAMAHGLVDSLGSADEALRDAGRLAGIRAATKTQ
jgi:protease-4